MCHTQLPSTDHQSTGRSDTASAHQTYDQLPCHTASLHLSCHQVTLLDNRDMCDSNMPFSCYMTAMQLQKSNPRPAHAITTTSPCTRITIVTHPTTAVQTLVLSTDGDQIVHCRNWTALSHSSPTSQPITNRIEHRQLSVLCA